MREWVAATIRLVLYEEFFWKSLSTGQNFPFGLKEIFIACVESAGYFIWLFFLRWRPQNGAVPKTVPSPSHTMRTVSKICKYVTSMELVA